MQIVYILTKSKVLKAVNGIGEAFLRRQDIFRMDGDKLTAPDAFGRCRLDAAILQTGQRGYSFLLTPDAEIGTPLLCHIEPFVSEKGPEKQLALMITDLTKAPIIDSVHLAKIYGLSRAEVDIVVRLAHGETAQQIAVDTGRSVETVRKHIRNAMRKSNTRRQSEPIIAALKLSR